VEHGLRGGGESDSGASPAGAREVGDDRWGPPVIGCARGGGEAGWRRWLAGPKGQLGRRTRAGLAGASGPRGLERLGRLAQARVLGYVA
jgi:hypothetical protein